MSDGVIVNRLTNLNYLMTNRYMVRLFVMAILISFFVASANAVYKYKVGDSDGWTIIYILLSYKQWVSIPRVSMLTII